MQEKEPMITVQNHRIQNEKKSNYVVLYNDDGHYKRKDFLKHHLIDKLHAAGHGFSVSRSSALGLNGC